MLRKQICLLVDVLFRAGALAALHSARAGGRNWVADALARNAASRPTWPVYRMLDAAGGVQDSITCAGAHHAAQALAAFLTGPAGLRPGDRAVLCYPPGAPAVPATSFGCCIVQCPSVHVQSSGPLASA